MRSRRRLLAWSVPVGVAAVVAAVGVIPQLMPAAADPVPNLPQLTPAELLVKVSTADVETFSGDVELTADLGLPDLGAVGGSGTGSLLDYLAGTHTSEVWVDGPQQLRVAVPAPGAESSWIRNGSDLWAWNSRTQAVTHASIPTDDGAETTTGTAPAAPLTPPELAQQLLANLDPSTVVSVQTPGYVADRPVYELVLEPRSPSSTIGTVTIAVDAATGAPLDAKITARGASGPALELGFTSVSFDKPDPSTFTFTPPPGATVTESSNPSDFLGLGGDGDRNAAPDSGASSDPSPPTTTAPMETATVVGADWDSVVIISGAPLGDITALLPGAQAVTGPAGPGRLITTALVNVLVLDDGRVAIGAVTPDALQAAVPAR
jgi:outer membrane lipoprotein-sorting protein